MEKKIFNINDFEDSKALRLDKFLQLKLKDFSNGFIKFDRSGLMVLIWFDVAQIYR